MSDAEEDYDETPSFIDMSSAVEVNLPETGEEPMDDDDEDDGHNANEAQHTSNDDNMMQDAEEEAVPIVDQSKVTITSHGDAVYAVSAYYDNASKILSIVSGAGDDRAFLHFVSSSNNDNSTAAASHPPIVRTIPLSHAHTDSISCVSFNTPYIHSDVSGKPQRNLLAVGSYDGSIVLYDGKDGSLVKVLEGPSDVEWCCFHPKGGTKVLSILLFKASVSLNIFLSQCIALTHIRSPLHQSSSALQKPVATQVLLAERGVTAGAFTPDGKWVVSAGQDGTVRVWAPKTGMSKHVFRLVDGGGRGGMEDEEEGSGGGLTCLAVGGGQDGQLAIAGGEDGNAYVVHVSGKKLVATLTHFEGNSVTAPGRLDGNEDMQDDEGGEEGEARSVEAVGFCPSNITGTAHWCATGGVDGALKIWNLNVGGGSGGAAQLRQRCIREDVKAGITRLKWHNSLPLVIASYTDGCVCVWDARVGKVAECLTGHEDMINDMDACFVDGTSSSIIVTGSDDKAVKVFEFNLSQQ
ncbi:hypothetical protein HJC23_005524 [Cyclotella cryptica]|uniref:Uncharacterized protein n=1 Tax=Cyclotella cryptica TaxID=29204 RepID=A0ABD3PYA1_9STRA